MPGEPDGGFMNNLPLPSHLYRRRAFTLVELLVVVAIVAVLAAVLMPAFKSANATEKQAKCASRLRSCMVAMHSYLADTSASEITLYSYDGAKELRWNTDLIAKGYLKLADTQDPVWPVTANSTLTIYGALQDGPSGLYVNQQAPGTTVPRGFILRVRNVEKPAQTLVLANSNLDAGRLTQYGSIYKNSGSTMTINLVHNGKANAAFLDGHVEAVDGPRYKEIISRMFGSTQTVSVFENGQVVRY
jgi:prepilin-type N-terminal cleavage/methylation domain-containing protein/prepilin-type processing-associated H-X9-DG protein